jgi:hypothetical protein
MMMTQRKPMTFDMNAAQRVPAQVRGDDSDRQQVGSRVTKVSYRRLKARAALQGVTVQALVEQAIDEFLAKHPD